MCDPLTIAGMALTAGSTVMHTMAANKAAKARSDAISAERMRQNTLEQEANALNTASQDRYGPGYEKGREATAKQLGDVLGSQDIGSDTAVGGVAEGPPDTSAVAVQESKKQQAAAKDYTAKQGQARGKLLSFGDYLGDTSRMQARDASLVGQIGGFMKDSSNQLPYELDAASHKGDSLNMFGDLLNLGGSLALGKGLQNPDWNPLASSGGTSIISTGSTDPWAGMRTVTSPLAKPKTLSLGGLYH